MSHWIATSFGALDLSRDELNAQGYEIAVIPTRAATPLLLFGDGARLWRRLCESAIDETTLDPDERALLTEFEQTGIAAPRTETNHNLTRLRDPWLSSVMHELVYALIAHVARANGIELVFIKGPTLHAQGIRERRHSGDVDCWVLPGEDIRLADAMREWGWVPLYSPFSGTGVAHSLTLRPMQWGCAIDVHTRYPGMTVEPAAAFGVVLERSEPREFAGVVARTPDSATHAVIAGLHEMRPFVGAPPGRRHVALAASALRTVGPEAIALSARLGASYALAPALESAFPGERVEFVDMKVPEDWGWRLTASNARRHLKAAMTAPLRKRPGIFLRLVWPADDMLRTDLEIPEASRPELVRVRLRRLRALVGGRRRTRIASSIEP